MSVTDAIGQTIEPGATVAYSRRSGSSLYIEKRKVHSVVEQRQVKMFETVSSYDTVTRTYSVTDTETPSRAWADSKNMVVVNL